MEGKLTFSFVYDVIFVPVVWEIVDERVPAVFNARE